MGKYEEMDFSDTMGDAYEKPEMDKEIIHSKLQRVYGLWLHEFALILRVNCLHKIKHTKLSFIIIDAAWSLVSIKAVRSTKIG